MILLMILIFIIVNILIWRKHLLRFFKKITEKKPLIITEKEFENMLELTWIDWARKKGIIK